MTPSATLEAPTTPPCACEARTATHSPRERWRYIGREVHYGHRYDMRAAIEAALLFLPCCKGCPDCPDCRGIV